MPAPNILLLLSDEHSFRYLGHVPECEGGEAGVHTPALDRLAATGTVFTDAYCQMPLCTPSRISLLCGREVRGCGAWNNESVLRPELDTLPRALGRAGYATCLVGKMHLGGTSQFAGFQHRPYGDLTGRCGHQWEPIRAPATGMRERTSTAVGVTSLPESLMQEEVVVSESQAWLREQRHARPDQPWMLCASFSRPHFPLTAPRRWIDRYPAESVPPPRFAAGGDAWDHPMSVGLRKGFRSEEIDAAECQRARACYRACVSYLDEILGGMLLRLGADGLLENTVIVYTTDHGEMAGEHGVWWKNGWYEGCTRVPLIVSTPAQRRGAQPPRKVRTPVALLDLFPTFCGFAGMPIPKDLDGADLSPAVLGAAEPPARPIVCDSLNPRWGAGTEFRSVRRGRFKYVRFRDAAPLCFDLVDDPGEQRNLLVRGVPPQYQDEVATLARFADESMDFEIAGEERTVRDGGLRKQYPQLPGGPGTNLYILPDGRVVHADRMLYEPSVVGDSTAQCSMV
jgi:choline-sulfatase